MRDSCGQSSLLFKGGRGRRPGDRFSWILELMVSPSYQSSSRSLLAIPGYTPRVLPSILVGVWFAEEDTDHSR